MLKIIRESFQITNSYIIIATPLILFSLISSLYLIFSGHSSNIGLVFTLILFFLMLAAFISGWFKMVTTAVREPDGKAHLLPEFTSGVGEYFIPVIGFMFNVIVISIALIVGCLLLGKKFIGAVGVPSSDVISAMTSLETMKTFVGSLSQEQLMRINKWNILIFSTMIFNYFILMFYAPAMFFKRRNPYVALWLSVRDLFSAKFFKNIGLFLIVFVSYMTLSAISTIFGSNIIMHFILTLINFYYVTFIAVFVFNYYYSNYAKIGSTIDKMV